MRRYESTNKLSIPLQMKQCVSYVQELVIKPCNRIVQSAIDYKGGSADIAILLETIL